MDPFKAIEVFILSGSSERNFKKGNFSASLRNYLKLIPIYQSLGENSKLAVAYRRIAECYHEVKAIMKDEQRKNFIQCIQNYDNAGEKYSEIGEHLNAGDCYENAGKVSEEIGDLNNACEYLSKSIEHYVKSGNLMSTSHAYLYLARCYEKVGSIDLAAENYEKAGEYNLKIADDRSAASNYESAARLYENRGIFDKALSVLANSASANLRLREYSKVADLYQEMAEDYLRVGDMKNSLYYNKKAAEIRFENKDYVEAGISYLEMGASYEAKKDYEGAMKYYLQSAEITLNAKSYEQAALSYEKVGDCYEKMGDPLKASEYYVYAAKTMVAAGKPKSAVNTFERAGVNFLEEAESLLVDKDYSNALSYYGKAAECFIGLGEYAKAGDIFIKKAEAHSKLGQEQLVRECFVLAAENFLKAKDEKSAGYAYKMVGEFDKSSLNYTRYAEKKAKSGDDFQAGEGCILAARSFSSMGEDAKRRDSYNLALWHYGKVLKESHSESKEGIQLLADAAERMGECYVDVSDLHNAEKYLRQAVDLYNKIGNTVGNSLSNAMLSRVRGEFALELGNHSQAMEYFAYSARAFNDLIKSGKFESDFVDYLNQHLDSVQNLIYKIELKPEIDLVVDKSIYAFTDSDILVNGVLYNNGKNNINTITFISHLPEQFTLVKIPPEIKVLKPGESLRVTAELRVKNPGEHVLKPFEIFYRDDKGNKYVKASNESLIYALERPPEDFKNSRMAVEVYVRYANTHIANKNYFYAGDGFKKAAEIYGTFNTDKKTAEYYESAINAYGDYIKSQPLDSEDFVILGFIGDAFWNIAESHESMGNLDGAIKNYRQALSYFEKSNSKVKISFGNALLSKTQAKKSIESGSWEDASELLSKSTEFLSETLKKGGLNATQMKLVDRHMAEVKLLMDKIKETPVVSLSIDVPRTVNAGRGFQMKIVVANPGGLSLKNMKLMVNVPDGFVIENTPAESFDLPPKSSKDFSIDVTASIPGEYVFKPVQLFYNDNKGNGFMRGSSELKITVLRDEEAKAAEEVSADARPEVNVYFKQPERSLVGVKLMLEGVIENTGVVTVNGLRFISSVPQEFEVSEVPEVIKELKGNSKQNISLGVTPLQEGEYTFKPLEMFYRDPHGNRYFKGSSDIKLKVVRPEGKPR